MQVRASFLLDGAEKKLVLAAKENETREHLALLLAAYVLFFPEQPHVDLSLKHPSIAGLEFQPDLLALDVGGSPKIWIECGNVSTNKLDKLAKRLIECRFVVLKANEREAKNLRKFLEKNEVRKQEQIEIFYFPGETFSDWLNMLDDSVEIYGEWADRRFNLVANAIPFDLFFERI